MSLKYDQSHRFAIKSAIEEVLGKNAWYELKESTSLVPWRRNVLKVLQAIRLSIVATITIRDEAWALQVEENLSRGENAIRSSKDIDNLLSAFEATLLRQVFLHVGFPVSYTGRTAPALRREHWKLDSHRSVLVIQTPAQVEAKFWSEQQVRIGVERQMDLHNEHRRSKSKQPYSVWSREREA